MTRWFGFVLALVLLAACGGGGTGGTASAPPQPKASPAPNHADVCARLAQRVITPCPPADLKWLQAQITNATAGQVSDQEAQKWGQAELRSATYSRWAYGAMADSFLESGAIADPNAATTNVFQSELEKIQTARSQNGKLVLQPVHLQSLKLVPLPARFQQLIQQQGLRATPYGFVGHLVGPARYAMRKSDGTEVVFAELSAEEARDAIEWGSFRPDPDLGPIWYSEGFYGCHDPQVRAACQIG